ncbi:hypothetical protein [Saccharicrinis aurantiacus]|uniref:hypothetical protein n=1 Tax=Saccharicrinis aurantiacus TaxID=1849719 RepID=UPI0008380395|nr:hypothetical protein [Saccharicrinis aurantiacus]
MKNGSIQIVDLEFEYQLWKGRLSLYTKEVDLLIKRNETILNPENAHKLNSIEIMALEEHKSIIESALSKINVKEQEIEYYIKDFPITHEHQYFVEHLELRKQFEKLILVHTDRVKDIITAIGAN